MMAETSDVWHIHGTIRNEHPMILLKSSTAKNYIYREGKMWTNHTHWHSYINTSDRIHVIRTDLWLDSSGSDLITEIIVSQCRDVYIQYNTWRLTATPAVTCPRWRRSETSTEHDDYINWWQLNLHFDFTFISLSLTHWMNERITV